ncbi:MAG TPA: Trm112 family protein [bacterium]|jgi:uncharacterized protein YbaR (Trm112 family)|nr:Trm112 family protein [bacterium]HNT64327.1 Trm112 family protein [bacterium]HOX85317.1 Trm112 family protein [bacterium]HPG44476.1 Trm112 family protein [bacterium]HPM97034.1 Trm112 family protein [bacterium]
MPISKELLDILCCPKTRIPVQVLTDEQRERANKLIRRKKAVYADGTIVEEELIEGLITSDGKTIYRIDDNIPIMTIERGIPAGQFVD